MGVINWNLGDPIVETISFFKDTAGFWNVSVTLQEQTPGSLKEKAIKVKLIDETKTHGTKDIGESLWPVSATRESGKPSRTTLIFNTASTTRPNHMKVEIEPL